jgi:hypothetical protein
VKGHRIQLTVRLEPQVMQAARQRSSDMKVSLSATVAEAAKESLLSSYRSEREQEILKAVDRNFHALRRFERQLRLEIQVLKEMIGVGMRSFFNHTTPIPEATKNAAIRSGKERFHRYLDMVASNLRSGESILKDLPLPEPAEPEVSPATASGGEAAKRSIDQATKTEVSAKQNHGATPRSVDIHPEMQPLSGGKPGGQRNWGLFQSNEDA